LSLEKRLIERYYKTGKIGFITPRSLDEAMEIVNVLVQTEQSFEEPVYSVSEVAERLKEFFRLN
jgi:hypothetical protein